AFYGEAAGDVISNFENVTGGAGNDTLYGSAGDNVLRGQGGHDTIAGGDGSDTLYGDDGNDWLEGGIGNDIIFGGYDNDVIFGGNDNDLIRGGAGADTLDGGSGTDTLDYSDDTFGIYIDLGTNTTSYGLATGDVISNFENVAGGSAADVLIGNGGSNVLQGVNGADSLFAEGGNDIVYGGIDNDTLYGGDGNDTLFGEGGRDTFAFNTALNAATNVDQIMDFSVTEDTIALSRSVFGGFGASVSLVIGTGATANNAAQVVYGSTTGALYYDPDGASPAAQVKFAQLSTGLALTTANFALV
ncbi:calcium-binding protein, partial [Microvirga sp. 2MCAF35]|uniref:calcium-binding protein n=1 Tax=Microvirga sp. 2MCAF35 TaxID=3232987 RepID=UPI003F974684